MSRPNIRSKYMVLYWNESLHEGATTQNFCTALCIIVLRIKAFVQQAPCTTSPGLHYILSESTRPTLFENSIKNDCKMAQNFFPRRIGSNVSS